MTYGLPLNWHCNPVADVGTLCYKKIVENSFYYDRNYKGREG
jgi:hypothetical protein